MGCCWSSPRALPPGWDQRLPPLPPGMVRLTPASDPALVAEAREAVTRSFAGTRTTAPEGCMSWALDPTASGANPSDPLLEDPTPERLAAFRWLIGAFFSLMISDGTVFVLVRDGRVASAALLMPPNHHGMHEMGPCPVIRGILHAGLPPAAWVFGRSAKRLDALASAASAAHGKLGRTPHWYLQVCATAPEAQGKGCGSAVLRYVAALGDAYACDVYLETLGQRNISIYGKYGFTVSEQRVLKSDRDFPGEALEVDGGFTTMIRRPKGTQQQADASEGGGEAK